MLDGHIVATPARAAGTGHGIARRVTCMGSPGGPWLPGSTTRLPLPANAAMRCAHASSPMEGGKEDDKASGREEQREREQEKRQRCTDANAAEGSRGGVTAYSCT